MAIDNHTSIKDLPWTCSMLGFPPEPSKCPNVAPGFYFAVVKEGKVATGDSIELFEADEDKISVADVVNLNRGDAANQNLLRRVSELPSLPNSWREYFRKRPLEF